MEGGGMRGLYTAGVIDVLMENEIYADSAVGVSAGAVFGCNYKSRQIGRVLRYNKKYCKDKRLASIRNWITTGDVYSREFGYYELPWKLDIFDRQTYAENPMKFTVVCTDLDTGKPVYHECPNGDVEDIEWMRASASIPIASRPVKLGGKRLLDGGVSDPIPVKWMLSRGYEKNVVVLTRDVKYRKKANPKMQLFLKAVLHKYPAFLKDLEELPDRKSRYEKGSGEAESLPGFLNHRPKQNSTYTPFYVMILDIITTERGIFNGRKTSEYKTQTYKPGRACPRGCRKDDIIGRPAF